MINVTVRPPQCKNTESHRVFFLMIWTPKSHGLIYFVFVRFYFFSFDLQYIGIYFCYSFHLVCHWNIAIMFWFFFCVIYCFLSLLLILEHQPLKLSGVYFRCRIIIVQPKAIFVYVLNVCIFLQWLFTILGYCVHILMTSSFSVESITKKCLLELPSHQILCITPASFCW